MSGSGAPVVEPVDAAGLTLGIVATTWHAEITDQLLARAVEAAKASGVMAFSLLPYSLYVISLRHSCVAGSR